MTEIRRAQERHSHAVFTETEPGFAPGGGAAGNHLRDDGTYASAGGGGGGGAGGSVDTACVRQFSYAGGTQLSEGMTYPSKSGSSIGWSAATMTYSGYPIETVPCRVMSGTGFSVRTGYLNASEYVASMSTGFEFEWWFGWVGAPYGARFLVTADSNTYAYGYKSMGIEIENSHFSRADDAIYFMEDANSSTGGYDPVGGTWTDTGFNVSDLNGAVLKFSLSCEPGASTVDASLWRSDTGAVATRTMTNVPDSGVYGTYASPYTLRTQAYYVGNGYTYGQYLHVGPASFTIPWP